MLIRAQPEQALRDGFGSAVRIRLLAPSLRITGTGFESQ